MQFFRHATCGSAALAVAVILLALQATACAAAKNPVELPVSACKPLTSEQAGSLPTGYKRYEQFTRVCAVPGSDGRLNVIAVWVDDYYSAATGTPVAENIPMPLLVGAKGELLGELPAHYPGEAPLSTSITFLDWQADWPHRIQMNASTAAQGDAPRLAPLLWDSQQKKFVTR